MEKYKANNDNKLAEYLQESETGLYYFYARWYDPQVGRFITKDPETTPELLELLTSSTPALLNPLNFNRYVYAINNPLRITDPTGEKSVGYYICVAACAALGCTPLCGYICAHCVHPIAIAICLIGCNALCAIGCDLLCSKLFPDPPPKSPCPPEEPPNPPSCPPKK